MSDAAAIDDADPSGQRRCAKCLYDRRGLPAESPCPECGFVLPIGVTVFTLFRRPEPRLAVAMQAASAALFLVMALLGSRRGGFDVLALAAIMLPGIGPTAVRAVRRAFSEDSRAVQLWMNDDGIGIERDADRYSAGRMLGLVAIPLLCVGLPIAVIVVSLQRIHWETPLIVGAVAALGALMVWRSRGRQRIPPPDPIAPPMVRWKDASYEIGCNEEGITLIVEPIGFWVWPRPVEVIGDAAVRDALEEAATRHRNVRIANAERGENPRFDRQSTAGE